MRKYWFLFLLVACSAAKEDPNLIQAVAIHNEATEIGHRASMGVSQLKSLEAKMDQAQLDSLHAISRDLSAWYESLVEVPGHEHEGHDHGDHDGHDHEGHNHDHGDDKNYLEGLSSAEVLAIQTEFRKEVKWMEARVINLMNNVREKDNK